MGCGEALAQLSRDHHRARTLGLALSHAHIDEAEELARQFRDSVDCCELSHLSSEEVVLLPALPDDEAGRELAERVLGDHAYLRDAHRRMARSGASPDVAFLHALGDRLQEHVALEEGELIGRLQESLGAAAFDELTAQLVAEPNGSPAAVVSRFLDAFAAGDESLLMALVDPEIELHPPRFTGADAYRGLAGLHEWAEEIRLRPLNLSFRVDDVRALDGSRALACIQLDLGDDEVPVFALFTVTMGRVREIRGYFSDEELLARVGHL